MTRISPLVSVIIPTYKRGNLVGKTIDSVIKQTYSNYELIIVDDASPDDTADWIAKNYPQLQLIRLPKNLGNGAARNIGLKASQGEFIAFLDHDDQWQPEYLATQVETLQSNPDAVLCYCNYWEIRDDNTKIFHDLTPKAIYPDFTYYLLMWNIIDSFSLAVIRKSALLAVGLLNESLKICNDMELYLRLSSYGKIIHVPETLVFKYRHQDNLCNDYWLWVKDELALHDIFFATEISQPYRHLKSQVKSYAVLKILRKTWSSHQDWFFALVMITKSFLLAPRYRLELLSKRLFSRIT
jgi:glycosyltransferase involved in cell wall biosynthesis